MKILDVNILLYVVNTADPLHERVGTWFDETLQGGEEIGLSWNVLAGFVRVSTNPRVFKKPLTIDEARNWLNIWLANPMTKVVTETDRHWSMYEPLLAGTPSGKFAMDANSAAIPISHDVTLASCDRDFAKFPGLRWENPLAE